MDKMKKQSLKPRPFGFEQMVLELTQYAYRLFHEPKGRYEPLLQKQQTQPE